MKHETDKNNAVVKSNKEKSKIVNRVKNTKISAEKKDGEIAFKIPQKKAFVKKLESVKTESKINVLRRNAKQKVVKTASRSSAKIVKNPKVKTIVSIKNTKPAIKKTESAVSKLRVNQKPEMKAPKISVKQSELKLQKAKTTSSAKAVHSARKKSETVVSNRFAKTEKDDKNFKVFAENSKRQPSKVSVKKTKIKKSEAKMTSSAPRIVSGKNKSLPVSITKVNLKTSVKPVKVQAPKAQTSVTKKVKAIETKIKTINLPIPRPPKKKKTKPISSAVFRGKKDRYSFEVFSLTEEFEPVPAVYVISRRKTDRQKKAHHSLVCIGQTNSIFDEVKKHRNGKCVKKHNANVISILAEGDEKKRLKIENDLKAAHTIACNLR